MEKIKQIEDYWNSTNISQSFLKKVLANDITESKKTGHAMSKGSFVDDLLCLGSEYVSEIYYILNGKFPTKMWKETIEEIYNRNPDLDFELDTDVWLPIFRELNKSKLKDENVISKMIEHQYYFDALIECQDKIMLQSEDAMKGEAVVNNFKTHPYCKHLFEQEGGFQVPLYWDFNLEYEDVKATVKCKGLVDKLNVDHNNKTIQIIDYKTTEESLSKWPRGLCRRFNVPFQLSYYYYGLNQCLDKLNLNGYTQLLPVVLIENIKYPGKPRIYSLTPQDIIQGRNGFDKIISTVVTEGIPENEIFTKYGWEDGIYKYLKSKQMGLADYDIDYHLNKGIFSLNSNT